ncbi:hypothetical protein HDV00_008440 [Rhizophlyctis rosea]|nr:hypothetical protein HDV00_008440 [Rhizophlyctis rosea]
MEVDLMDIDSDLVQQELLFEIADFRKVTYASSVIPSPHTVPQLSSAPKAEVVIVLDTNYLISHLLFLQRLLQILPKPAVLLLVPYIVINELDALKEYFKTSSSARRRNAEAADRIRDEPALSDSETKAIKSNLADCARQAIAFLHKYMLADNTGIKGQTIDQYVPGTDYTQLTNDDKILDCCRYAQLYMSTRTLLLSNDKNLCLKAHIHGIVPISSFKGTPDEFLHEIRKKFGLSGNTLAHASVSAVPDNPPAWSSTSRQTLTLHSVWDHPSHGNHSITPATPIASATYDDDITMDEVQTSLRSHTDGMEFEFEGANPIYPIPD